MPLKKFVDQVGPPIQADWLNGVDNLKVTVFADASTKALARVALTSDAAMEVANGGTGCRDIPTFVQGLDIPAYGGLTTGTAASYAAAPQFPVVYYDGLSVTILPHIVNTVGASLSVSGQSPTPIVLGDGSALPAGAFAIGVPVTLLYVAALGFWVVTNNASWSQQSGQFTPTWIGFSSPPGAAQVSWNRTGNIGTLVFPAGRGNSNSTSWLLLGLPAQVRSPIFTQQQVPISSMVNAGLLVTGACSALIDSSGSGSIVFNSDNAGGGWSATGNKGFNNTTTVVFAL